MSEGLGGRMGVRQWFEDLLSRGQAPELDPSSLVELQEVSYAEAPIVVEALRSHGIAASAEDLFDPATALTRARVMVRLADVPAATQVVEQLR